jgi:hypothetical protein
MAPDPDREEWNSVRDRFEELRRRETDPAGLDQILDDEIRRRFGQTIARALRKPSVRETLAIRIAR